MPKKNLTDRGLKALERKPAAKGKTRDVMDSAVPGFGVRISETGRRTFILLTRFPGSKHPTRRALGEYGELTLEQARTKARKWLELLRRGVDPRDDEERQRLVEQRKRENSFAAVAEDFIRHIHRQKFRTANDMERMLRQTFIKRWGSRPVTEITSGDIRRVIEEALDRNAKYQGFHDFALIGRFFTWAIGQDSYGLEYNPIKKLARKDLIGKSEARTRVLNDDELRALWRATERVRYPYRLIYRLLILTGLRLDEVCGAHWDEFDFASKLWTIPAARMKKTKEDEDDFLVPLTDAVLKVLELVPRFKGGGFLFSHNYGKHPVNSHQFAYVKKQLDGLMVEELQKMAKERGEIRVASLPPFVNHDIRRSVRTNLSKLKIAEEVREAILAHARPGIKGVYDRHQYLDEKREALTLWNSRLRDIMEPPPDNVVRLQA